MAKKKDEKTHAQKLNEIDEFEEISKKEAKSASFKILSNLKYPLTVSVKVAAPKGIRKTQLLTILPGINPKAKGDKALKGRKLHFNKALWDEAKKQQGISSRLDHHQLIEL